MSQKPSTDRDALDQAIAAYAKAARRPDNLPAPGQDEPTDDELLRVVEGSATREERTRVEEAAAHSAWTRDRLEILRDALAETGHVTPLERAARFVFVVAGETLGFLRGVTAPLATPAAAVALRKGADAPVPSPADVYFELSHEFDDVGAVIRVEHAVRAACPIDLELKLTAAGSPATGARVTLLRGSTTVDSSPVDGRGVATFTGLEIARYRVEVRRAGHLCGSVILDFVSGEA